MLSFVSAKMKGAATHAPFGQCDENVFLKIKPKMRDVLGKMREIRQNAGFPARLRDG